jgi:putative FmdB family regulatory protein
VPTYQYACTECGHGFEQVQSFTDDALTVCPECHGRLRKVFNAVGVVFKGSGFYKTDSRTAAKAASSSGSASESSGSSDSKSTSSGSNGGGSPSGEGAKSSSSSSSTSSSSSAAAKDR